MEKLEAEIHKLIELQTASQEKHEKQAEEMKNMFQKQHEHIMAMMDKLIKTLSSKKATTSKRQESSSSDA